ncbi:hypothetical protein [Dickeya dianthicola]|uniref:hypothetical protein n=1 Tax=Dickeya dianthicola TaxID=204039 RepID=UPI0030185B43
MNGAFAGSLEGLTVGSGVRDIGRSYDVIKNWRVQVNATNPVNHYYISTCNFWCHYAEERDIPLL